MKKNTQRVLDYCLEHGLISTEQFATLKKECISTRGKDKSLYTIMAHELGWDKEKARTIIKQALSEVLQGLKESESIDILSTAVKIPSVSKKNKQSTISDKDSKDYSDTDIIVAPVPSEDAFVGSRFGKYILKKKLGSGGMGAVFKGYHPKLQTYFALKIVLSEKLGEEGIQRFEREARVSSKLKHPNIVQVHDVGVQGEKHYIVMDYIEGRTLKELIEQKRFWPRKAFEILLQIAKALQYSHDQGIIHRDIKPSNIMIVEKDGKDIPYLMDFGIASVVKEEGLTREGQIMGTPQYMSPEQARASKDLDARSDIYSLGAVLYEMLSGKPVVEANQVMAVFYEVLHKDPPMLSTTVPGIAKDVEAVTMKCLEKEPSRRYQKADEIAEEIERYLRGEAVLARSPGYLYRLWQKAMRNLKFTAVIASAIILVIGVVVLWILSLQKQARELEKTQKAQAKELERTKEEALKGIKDKINETWNEVNKQESAGNFEKALEYCKTVINLDPTDKRFSNKLVEITQKKESQQKEARKYYDRAMEVFWNPRLEEKDIKRCKKLFEKAINEYYAFADAHFQAGRAAHRLVNIEEAVQHYKNSMDCDPNLTPPKYYMTVLELSPIILKIMMNNTDIGDLNKKFEEIWGCSIDKIKTSTVSKGPSNEIDPYPLLGRAFLFLSLWVISENNTSKDKVWKECLDCCNKVIKEHPDFLDAYLIRAQLYSYWIAMYANTFHVRLNRNPEDLDQALKDCSYALYLDPYRNEVYALRGAIYKSIGAYDIAEKDYTNAVILKKGRLSGFYRDRAVCYVAMGKWNLAMKDLDKNEELTKQDPYDIKEEALLWKAFLQSWLNEKKESEQALIKYISSRSSYKAPLDGFVKGFVYMAIDDDFKRGEDAFRSLLKANVALFKFIQVFVIIAKNKYPDYTVEDFAAFLKGFPKLICLDPRLKQLIKEIPNTLSFKDSTVPFMKQSIKQNFEFSAIARACLENLSKDKSKQEKLKRVNMLFNQEYPPLTIDAFIYTLDYISEKLKIETAMKLKELPSSSLYYRRAIEYYFRSKLPVDAKKDDKNIIVDELEKARCDLESALELEPDLMEAHYSLSAVYSLLSGSNPEKRNSYKNAAIYHLRKALENGWCHLEDYTLKDDDFKPLGLGNEISLETLRSWGKEWEENRKQINRFESKVNELISMDNTTGALRLLYNPEYSYRFKELTESVENKVVEYFNKIRENRSCPDTDIERKVESLFGERGITIWKQAEMEKETKKQK